MAKATYGVVGVLNRANEGDVEPLFEDLIRD